MPNFKGMHEREFARSATIDQHQKGIEERAKMLTSGKKFENKGNLHLTICCKFCPNSLSMPLISFTENFPKPSDAKSRRKLDMAGAKAKATITKPNETPKETSLKSKQTFNANSSQERLLKIHC